MTNFLELVKGFIKGVSKMLFCVLMVPVAIFVVAPLALVFVVLALGSLLLLQVLVWILWLPQGKRALVVYSNRPLWKADFEENILPRIYKKSIVLNYSHRKMWKKYDLSFFCFKMFGRKNLRCPVVHVFRPFRWVKTFRLLKAYRNVKRADALLLENSKSEIFRLLQVQ